MEDNHQEDNHPDSESATRPAPMPLRPDMPVDHGLSGLGLIMQLGGSLYFALAVMVFSTLLFLDGGVEHFGLLLLFFAASAVRSWFHRGAGTTMLYGTPAGSLQRPLSGVNTYIWVALGHTALATWVFLDLQPDKSLVAGLVLSLCAWPVVLAIATRRRAITAMSETRPRADDFGLEGASILMVIFGVIGVLSSVVMLYVFLFKSVGGAGLTKTSLVIMAGLLLFRSVLHVIAGERGISEADREAVTLAVERYVSFSKVSTGVVGVLLSFNVFQMGSVFSGVFLIGGIVYLLLIWPLALDSFVDRYRIDVALSETAVSRAPDSGLTTLGWLLVAFGAIGTVSALASVVLDVPSMGNEILPGLNMSSLVGTQEYSPLWFVAIAGLQLWAGLELLYMSARARMAAAIYGGVAALVTLYLVWPMINDLASLARVMQSGVLGDGLIQVAQLGMAVALPVATFALAVRGGRSIRATARYRAEAPATDE